MAGRRTIRIPVRRKSEMVLNSSVVDKVTSWVHERAHQGPSGSHAQSELLMKRLFQRCSGQENLRTQQNWQSARSQENVLKKNVHELAQTRKTFPARSGPVLSGYGSLGADGLQRNPDAKRKSSAPGFEDGGRDLPAGESATTVAHARNECQPGQFPDVCHLEPATNRSGVFRLGSLRRAHHARAFIA